MPEEIKKVSPLDPDFLLFALPLAALIDILDFVLEIGMIPSFLLGGILIWWYTKRTGQEVDKEQLKEDYQLRQQRQRASKAAARSTLRRGIIMFVAELVPFLNLVPFWLIFVVSSLKQKPQPAKEPTSV